MNIALSEQSYEYLQIIQTDNFTTQQTFYRIFFSEIISNIHILNIL